MNRDYKPQPIDTSEITLPRELLELVEKLPRTHMMSGRLEGLKKDGSMAK